MKRNRSVSNVKRGRANPSFAIIQPPRALDDDDVRRKGVARLGKPIDDIVKLQPLVLFFILSMSLPLFKEPKYCGLNINIYHTHINEKNRRKIYFIIFMKEKERRKNNFFRHMNYLTWTSYLSRWPSFFKISGRRGILYLWQKKWVFSWLIICCWNPIML